MNRKRKQKIGVTLLAGLAACLLGGATYADEVVVGNLESIPATGVPGLTPQKIKLSSNRPAAIKNEPTYRGKPLYGTHKRVDVAVDAEDVGQATKGDVSLLADGQRSQRHQIDLFAIQTAHLSTRVNDQLHAVLR